MSILYSFKEAFAGFHRARLSFFVSVFTISFLLFIIGIFGIISLNVNQLIQVLNAKIDIQVFISNVLNDNEIAKLGSSISGLKEVQSVEFVSKETAARDFQKEFGEELFSMLDDNPLPSSFNIKLKEEFHSVDDINAAARQIEVMSGVDEVVYQSQALTLLTRFSEIAYFVIVMLLSIVIFGSLFVVSNTIRLIVLSRKDIIYTMRLVGATSSFISRPFIIEGLLQGLLGGAAAFVLSYGLVSYFNNRFPGVLFIQLDYLYIIPIAGLLFGYIGSLIAIKRYL